MKSPPTVKQLLQHRAGIYCAEFPQLFGWVENQLDDFADPHQRLQLTVDTCALSPPLASVITTTTTTSSGGSSSSGGTSACRC